jgi:hypothetical protein
VILLHRFNRSEPENEVGVRLFENGRLCGGFFLGLVAIWFFVKSFKLIKMTRIIMKQTMKNDYEGDEKLRSIMVDFVQQIVDQVSFS